MIAVLKSDAEYAKEYADFVESVSYDVEGKTPDYQAAVEALEDFIPALTD